MQPLTPAEVRRKIILDYAKWTALSALRSGAPVKKRKSVYPLLDAVAFDVVLTSETPITSDEFNRWHEEQTLALCNRDKAVPVGWAVKMINVYLKTAVYVGNLGRPDLVKVIHPPIDSGLWKGLRAKFRDRKDSLKKVRSVERIKNITDYKTYRSIIEGCQELAEIAGCSLIELEQFWLGADTPT